jgi:hypothetical protein
MVELQRSVSEGSSCQYLLGHGSCISNVRKAATPTFCYICGLTNPQTADEEANVLPPSPLSFQYYFVNHKLFLKYKILGIDVLKLFIHSKENY